MKKIAIIGLGYVGLPLAHAFSSKYKVIGFDINSSRVNELNSSYDNTNELSDSQVSEALKNDALFTTNTKYLSECSIYIITVPTPIDKKNQPNLKPLKNASTTVGKYLNLNDIVIYESTVFPGATEEVCVPILEEISGLKFNRDFFCGYSPERINPGDKKHTVTKIKKVVSGSTPKVAKIIDELYSSIITAGTYLAPSIKVAEAAKIIENTQRDINIAFINELAIIFEIMGIDTSSVLAAARTKWNFIDFKPGLVGGHCIGVDPYYLTYKSNLLGYKPNMILAGREINDSMGKYIALRVQKMLKNNSLSQSDSRILILGATFKENCPDIRNSKVFDVYKQILSFNKNVEISDYLADPKEVRMEYNVTLLKEPIIQNYDCVIVAVAHEKYRNLNFKENQVIFDIKSVLKKTTDRL